MTAENYHLKWDSHASYLNSSVATLYKNEKYADVVLYSSNTVGLTTSTIPTVGISAHKFILSSCSQYFAAIFENSPVANNNGPFHIVLPPDLSHRAVQILVQYMYVGEATVANDILNEVLKGGEILKIRGLCRTTNAAPATTNLNQTSTQNGIQQASYNLTRMPALTTTSATSVRYLVEQPIQPVLGRGGLIASVLPKDSPVIIKTAKPLSTLAAASTNTTTATVMGKLTTNAIGINKHVAIDPGDTKCCYTTEAVASNVRDETSSMCQDIGCNGCSRITKTQQPQQIMMPRERNDLNDTTQVMCIKPCPDTCNQSEYITQTPLGDCVDEDPSLMYDQEMELATTTLPSSEQHSELLLNYTGASSSYNYTTHHHLGRPNQSVLVDGSEMQHLVSTSPSLSHESATTTSFVATIKEEPTEWLPPPTNTTQQLTMETLKKNIVQLNDLKVQHNIKSEPPQPTASTSSSSLSSSQDVAKENGQQLISGSRIVTKDFEHYFSCDICKKTCEDKSSLLRHLETHSATPCTSGFNASIADAAAASTSSSNLNKSYVPKKRRRTSQQENSTDHVCLQCDLCSTRFETPAEWVRHMSTQHTDVELAIFNSRKDSEKSKSNNPSSSNTSNKKHGCTLQPQQSQQQQHLPQRVQALGGSTNSNLPSNSSTSVLCTSNQEIVNDTNVTDNLRSTMSPA